VSTRYERMRMQRRMQQRIRLVVEERRIAHAPAPDPGIDAETTIELPPRAVGRVTADSL
jgi:hypothetical protein